jgi:chaperone required for assembly of F1-ATPase
MRDILSEIIENRPLDATETVRRAVRPQLRKRFYKRAHAVKGEGGFVLLLDDMPVKTPARRHLVAPNRALADALAEEWNAQKTVIDPARMPLTRLANATIDAVVFNRDAVIDDVAKYLYSDLVCYRAEAPAGLVERQTLSWDPVLNWASETLNACFMQIQGVMYAAQPRRAIAAARAEIPTDPWRLAAVSSVASLTGSLLLALALSGGAFDADRVWAAAHVDDDWQMSQWGRDEIALERRAFREAELRAAALVLKHV